MKRFFTPNGLAFVAGCILFLISAVLLAKMNEMEYQLEELKQQEIAITEELKNYE